MLSLLGLGGLVGGVCRVGILAYYNVRYGLITPSPGDDELLNELVLSPMNLTRCILLLLGGVAGIAAACGWLKCRWRLATTLTLASCALLGGFVASVAPS